MATQKIRDPLIRRLFRDNDGLHNPFFSGNYFLRGVGGDIGGCPRHRTFWMTFSPTRHCSTSWPTSVTHFHWWKTRISAYWEAPSLGYHWWNMIWLIENAVWTRLIWFDLLSGNVHLWSLGNLFIPHISQSHNSGGNKLCKIHKDFIINRPQKRSKTTSFNLNPPKVSNFCPSTTKSRLRETKMWHPFWGSRTNYLVESRGAEKTTAKLDVALPKTTAAGQKKRCTLHLQMYVSTSTQKKYKRKTRNNTGMHDHPAENSTGFCPLALKQKNGIFQQIPTDHSARDDAQQLELRALNLRYQGGRYPMTFSLWDHIVFGMINGIPTHGITYRSMIVDHFYGITYRKFGWFSWDQWSMWVNMPYIYIYIWILCVRMGADCELTGPSEFCWFLWLNSTKSIGHVYMYYPWMVALVYGIFIKVNMQVSHGSVMGFDVDMNSFSGGYDILVGGSSTWIKSPQVSG